MPEFQPITFLFQKLRETYTIEGVSDALRNGAPGTRRIDWIGTPDQATMDAGYAIADNHNRLAPDPAIATIGTSPASVVITVPGLEQWDYAVYEWNPVTVRWEQISSGNVPDGSLEFEAFDTGRYVVEASIGNLTGYAEVEVI